MQSDQIYKLLCSKGNHKTPISEYRQNILGHNHSNIFLDQSPKAKEMKAKINNWDLIKLKSFCIAKDTSMKGKDNLWNGRKYLQTKQQTKDSSPKYTNSSCSSISNKQTTQSKNDQQT